MFGQPVQLTLNGNGTVFNTISGTCCTVLLSAFLIWYLLVQIIMFNTASKDIITHEAVSVDLNEIGNQSISLENSGALIYFGLSDPQTGQVYTAEEIKKFIQFRAIMSEIDTENPEEYVPTELNFSQCTPEDFTRIGNDEKVYQEIANYYGEDKLICVNSTDVQLRGNLFSKNPNFLMLAVDQCSNDCEEDMEKIETFVQDFMMNVFVSYN